MTKTIMILAIAAAFVAGSIVTGTFSDTARAIVDECSEPNPGSNNGKPFQELWSSVCNLQEQVTNIQLIPGPQGEQGEQGPEGPQGEQGEQGQPGADGESCNVEEQDDDSILIDCPTSSATINPPADGVDGQDGADGNDGQDGINCWDLNGNGEGDITLDETNEDLNGDGVVDVFDCQGPIGLQGLQGEIGLPGERGEGLTCANQIRIKQLIGDFELSQGCVPGPLTVDAGEDQDLGFGGTSTRSEGRFPGVHHELVCDANLMGSAGGDLLVGTEWTLQSISNSGARSSLEKLKFADASNPVTTVRFSMETNDRFSILASPVGTMTATFELTAFDSIGGSVSDTVTMECEQRRIIIG